MIKKVIKSRGENTAYAAKCHFKSADYYKASMKWLLAINILFAVFSIADLGDSEYVSVFTRIFGAISLGASLFILFHQSQEDKNIVGQHMEFGEEYLDINRELKKLYDQDIVSEAEFQKVDKRISRVSLRKDKPIINQFAKKMASRAIEKKGEVNRWWIEEQEDKNTNHATHDRKNKTHQS